MPINDTYKLDLAFKKLGYSRQATTTDKNGFEESIVSTFPTYANDIWAESDSIPTANGVTREVAGIVTKVNALPLTESLESAGHVVFVTGYKDFIPSIFHSDYEVVLTDNTGKRMYISQVLFFFDYASGTLIFPNGASSYTGYATPFKLTAYRYIGKKGLTSVSSANSVKQVVFQVGSDLIKGVQEHTEIKLPFDCKLKNCEVSIGIASTLPTNLVIEVQRYISISGVWQWSTLYLMNMGITDRYQEDSSVMGSILSERLRINLVSGNYDSVLNMSVILNVELI